MQEAVQTFQNCQNNVTLKHSLEIKDSNAEDSIKAYFDNICPILPEYFSCVTEFSTSADICFDNNTTKFKDTVVRIITRFGIYACQDGGQRVIDFHNMIPSCVIGNHDKFFQCLNVSTIQKLADTSNDEVIKLEITEEMCTDYRFLEGCLLSIFDDCNNNTATQVASEIFEIVRSELDCENIIYTNKNCVGHGNV